MRGFLASFADEIVKLGESQKPIDLDIGKVTMAPAKKPIDLDIGKVTMAPAKKPIDLDIGKVTMAPAKKPSPMVTTVPAKKPSPMVKRAAFADELLKLGALGVVPPAANPTAKPGAAAIQAKIDTKLAPFKPATPAPMQGPSATPAVKPQAQSLEQRMGKSFADIKAKAGASTSQAQIKTPRTSMGVRG